MTKRRTKAEKAADEAARLAGLLADAPSDADGVLAPPLLIADPRLAPAMAVWRELAPRLSALNLLEHLDRPMFALFCYYYAEWIGAVDTVLVGGAEVRVKTVAGGYMVRRHPAVDRRDKAADMLLDLSKRFGLTKMDRFALFRMERDSPDPAELVDAPGRGAQGGKGKPAVTEPSLGGAEWAGVLAPPHPRLN